MKPQRILREIKSAFPKGETKKIRLFHIVEKPELQSAQLREWQYTKYVKTDLAELANEIYEAAQSVADEMTRREKFEICGYKVKDTKIATIIINQQPDRDEVEIDPSPEGLIAIVMQFAEKSYGMLGDMLAKQGEMQRDLMNSYHKKLASLERREEILSEVVREYQNLNVDREDKQRREERFDRMLEVCAGYFAPAAAEKMLAVGLISPEAAAGISAAGKEISEEIAEDKSNGKKSN
jgi:hypothetical protein